MNMAPKIAAEIAATIIDPLAYGNWRPLLDAFAHLRRDMPIGLAEIDGYRPFWVITRYADILKISKDNQSFLNNPVTVVIAPIMAEMFVAHLMNGSPHLVKSLVQMDAPEHSKYRRLTQDWFMPANLKTIEANIRVIAKGAVDKMMAMDGQCDFARDIAAMYPLHVVMELLGVPEKDEPLMLKLTQELFGGQDPDLNRMRGVQLSPTEITEVMAKTVADFNAYFAAIAQDRRSSPRNDLATIIAQGIIDDAPIPDYESAGYYTIIATAGHDTTSASTSGAMLALAQDPEQFARIKADRSLLPGLIEEAIRWTTPVQHFMRTVAHDTEINGIEMKAGDWLMLCYISGNYDESVFPDAEKFDATRSPNRHVAFGSGAHQCLGLHLARLEMRILFDELLDRVDSVELDGTPQRSQSTFVGGLKTLPLKFKTA